MPEINRIYGHQLEQMHRNGREWLANHPDAQVRVVFHYPPHVFLVAEMQAALDMKFVTANKDGLDLIKALWPYDNNQYPTVAMARVVIENLVPEQ